MFARLGVRTVEDLLEYFPRDYDFRPPLTHIREMYPDHQVTISGRIETTQYSGRSRPPRFTAVLEDPTDRCRLIWFNGGYLREKIFPGDMIVAWGKVSQFKDCVQMVNPHWRGIQDAQEILKEDETGMPVYSATADLSSEQIERIIRASLETMLSLVEEWYPEEFRASRQMPSRRDAIAWIHLPPNEERIGRARRRLAYDELFLMELGMAKRRTQFRTSQPAFPLPVDERLDRRIRRLFPFRLTDHQDQAVREICDDLARAVPMNRLLQGDVGSGKTVVALYAALLAVGHHYQVAIMAPTEILAEQHFLSIEHYLQHSRVKRMLLKGGLTGPKRSAALEAVAAGEIDIVVGTHALLHRDVTFDKLAVVVIDEQHKFGVRQRELIRSKNIAPHCLVMTATPIPRTLAMTVFGDLDVSTIEHLPPGRRPVKTRWFPPGHIAPAYEFIRSRLQKGEQAYFVYPRIENTPNDQQEKPDQSEEDEEKIVADVMGETIKSAVAEHEKLSREVFPEYNVALLHGRLDTAEKQAAMEGFRAGRIHVLVSTVVIEVGVDVPKATLMVIEQADRFGLSQLHQLRGRIGRGTKQSYCLLFAEANTDSARARLETMTRTSNGFRVAEEDLRLRGPGEFFGTAQHGLPALKVADLISDIDLLRMARRDAFSLIHHDPELQDPAHRFLREMLVKKFGDNLGLIDVG